MESKRSGKHDGKEKRSTRLKSGGSTSEPDLITANRRPLPAGFPPGFIVDDLRWYRKKKPPGFGELKDHLTIKPEEGSMKKFKSEYKRCYKKYNFLQSSNEDLTDSNENLLAEVAKPFHPRDYFKLEGVLELHPEYYDTFKNLSYEKPSRVRRPEEHIHFEGLMQTVSEQHDKYIPYNTVPRTRINRRSSSLQRYGGEFMVKSSEMHSQFVKPDDTKRAEISRRPTSLQLEGDFSLKSETAEKFAGYLFNESKRPELAKASLDNLKLEGDMDTKTETTDKFVPFNVQERVALIKRDTNLHLEGEQDNKTENQEKYVPFNLEQRPALTKRDTNLHLEGDMNIQTEKQDKYVPYELSTRQKFTKRPTNLHLDGEISTTTEQHEKYIPFDVKRPPLTKKDTNLHLEGELTLNPEYREEFIEYNAERPKPKRPVNNLGIKEPAEPHKIKDNFFVEYQKPYRNLEPKFRYYYPPADKISKKPKENLKPEGALELSTESKTKFTEHAVVKTETKKSLDGEMDVIPENKNKHVRAKVVRPAEEITAQEIKQKRTRNYAQPAGNLKIEGHMESNPEYRSSYVDFPRERPVVRKPGGNLKSEGHVSHVSEKESQYVEHHYAGRPPLAKRDTELKMEGRFECQPEYRKAYIDYLTRENISRKPRPFDNLTPDERSFDLNYTEGLVPEPLRAVEKPASKIPLSKEKQKVVKPLKTTPRSSKSRSVSPDRRRKTPHAPRTPLQQRVLVPDMSTQTPRRPSSIFGPRTARWYPHHIEGIPSHRPYSEMEDIPRCCPPGCCPPECPYLCNKNISRWQSPCGRRDSYPRRESSCERRDYGGFSERCSPRLPSPSPPRRMWSKEYQPIKPDEKAASFVVLTDKVEINNNRIRDGTESRVFGSCCKEQKWMPPWYEPPM